MVNLDLEIPIVFVIGSGIRGKEQLTLEAISFIKKSEKVLFFPNGSLTEECVSFKCYFAHQTVKTQLSSYDEKICWVSYLHPIIFRTIRICQ